VVTYLTPEEAADRLPFGNADWVRAQLRTGRLRGSKVGGRWVTDQDAIDEMVKAGTNDTTRTRPTRRRRQRVTA
jgi:hypothetical protein